LSERTPEATRKTGWWWQQQQQQQACSTILLLFYAFSFLPYLGIPAADIRLSNSGEEAGCISRTNLKQSVPSSNFRVPGSYVLFIFTRKCEVNLPIIFIGKYTKH
jgi:hypothetical protein